MDKKVKIVLSSVALIIVLIMLFGGSRDSYKLVLPEDTDYFTGNDQQTAAKTEHMPSSNALDLAQSYGVDDKNSKNPQQSSIKFVPDKDMVAVGEKPKSLEQILYEMEKEKTDAARSHISVNQKQLDTEFVPLNFQDNDLQSGYTSEGQQVGKERKINIFAPVGYQLFTDEATYKKFQESNKGIYPAADFKKQNIIMLVSHSDLPNRIFELCDIENTPKELKVFYRVNSAASKEYSAINYFNLYAVPKTKAPIKLIETN